MLWKLSMFTKFWFYIKQINVPILFKILHRFSFFVFSYKFLIPDCTCKVNRNRWNWGFFHLLSQLIKFSINQNMQHNNNMNMYPCKMYQGNMDCKNIQENWILFKKKNRISQVKNFKHINYFNFRACYWQIFFIKFLCFC